MITNELIRYHKETKCYFLSLLKMFIRDQSAMPAYVDGFLTTVATDLS